MPKTPYLLHTATFLRHTRLFNYIGIGIGIDIATPARLLYHT